jgi:hypothetical protein
MIIDFMPIVFLLLIGALLIKERPKTFFYYMLLKKKGSTNNVEPYQINYLLINTFYMRGTYRIEPLAHGRPLDLARAEYPLRSRWRS